jgi:hypothetical protein
MAQNDPTTSNADVDRAFAQLEIALSGQVQPDQVDEQMSIPDAIELLLIGGTLYFLNWALQKIMDRLPQGSDES